MRGVQGKSRKWCEGPIAAVNQLTLNTLEKYIREDQAPEIAVWE